MTELASCADEVAAAFGLGSVTEPMRQVDRGEQAVVWRLETKRGTYAVKQPLPGFEPRADGVDIAFQQAVLSQTDVLLPAAVRRPGGGYLATVAGSEVRVSEWVELRPIDVGLDPALVGRALAALHRVEFPCEGGVDPWYWEPAGRDCFGNWASRLEAARAPVAETFRAAIPGLLELEERFEEPSAVRMCHRDLFANNVRSTPDGRLCVIDWDNCGPADPAHELAMVVYEFGYPDATRSRALHDAYVAAGGMARLVRPGQLTMVAAQFGHFYALAAEEWLDPTSSDEDRAHAIARIDELQDKPLSVEAARWIVDSVAGRVS